MEAGSNPTEQKSFKNSSKYTKKSKVDGTLPMLFLISEKK